MSDPVHPVETAIASRQSVRGFLSRRIAPELIRRLLTLAARAPSGSNIQPWQVHVVTGAKRDVLAQALTAAYDSQRPEARQYQYYPATWRAPYLERRRETGWGLYRLLGIAKGDRAASAAWQAQNFRFFGAPCALIFTIDDDLGQGSWLDYGMFLQNIMILARAHGLDTCPQAALANYPDVIKQHLRLADNQIVVCGMALGYADPNATANQFRTTRIGLAEFATFHEG